MSVSVPRRGFVVFLHVVVSKECCARKEKGDVSVPRRGFVVFLPISTLAVQIWTPTATFQSPEGDSLFFYQDLHKKVERGGIKVSVPRRGFVVFLPGRAERRSLCTCEFQSPEGDSLFFYLLRRWPRSRLLGGCFSPPKGIRCFSTRIH